MARSLAPAFAALIALTALAPGAAPVSPAYPTLVAVGSKSMAPLLRVWAEDVRTADEAFSYELEALGSSTAAPALVSGRASLGALSREMKWAEREVFRSRYGYDPLRVRVALDAIVVFVNEENPLTQLSVPQLDAIYSYTRSCGHPHPVERWEDVGVVGALAPRAPLPCGLARGSGTRAFFRQRALCGGYFRENLREQPGAGSAVRFVAEGLCGIGYSALAEPRAGVRELALAARDGESAAPPEAAAIYAGSYPLARWLYVYVNRPPGTPLAREVELLLRHALSDEGQARVREAGFLPLPGELRAEEEALLTSS